MAGVCRLDVPFVGTAHSGKIDDIPRKGEPHLPLLFN